MAGFWTGGPHPTSNLPGYPARDFGAPGGTPVYAWETLRVERLSGQSGYRGGGFGGLNVYLKDRVGRQFFMTHVENVRVKVGDTLRPGQQIAQVGNYGTPHVHLGYTGGDPVSTLGMKPEYLYTPGGAVAGAAVVEASAKRGQAIPALADMKTQSAGLGPIGWGKYGPEIGGIALGPGQVAQAFDIGKTGYHGVQSVGDALGWVTENWDRVLEVVGGILLVIVGLVLMGRSLGVTKTKIEIAEKAGRFAGEREYAAAGSPGPAKRENLRTPTVHEVTDEGERRAARRRRATGGAGQTDEIPF